ncbi:MAG: SCO family protein [Planctomycetota bacterium]
MNKFLPLLLLLAACADPVSSSTSTSSTDARQPEMQEKPLYEIQKLDDFNFQEIQGRALGRKDLLGKVWIASTMFTTCPTHCPVMCKEFYDLQEEFSKEEDFRLLMLTVDPARDTPEVLKGYAESYYARPDVWYFVRHPERKEIRRFVFEQLKLPWDDNEPLNHSYRLALIDRKGVVRGHYAQINVGQMKQLRKAIRELLAEDAS